MKMLIDDRSLLKTLILSTFRIKLMKKGKTLISKHINEIGLKYLPWLVTINNNTKCIEDRTLEIAIPTALKTEELEK